MECHIKSFSFGPDNTGLITLESDMLEQAIEQLVSGDFNARWSASKSLKSMGEVAHPSLISIVETNPQDPDLLSFIAEILGHSPTPDAILALLHLLKHCRDDEVRETVVLTLAKQGPNCVNALLSYLDHPGLQGTVLRALIQIGHPSTIIGLLRCLDHDDAAIRALAFEGIGQFHQEAIAPLLIQGLKDRNANVRCICVKALGRRSQSDIDESLITAVAPLLHDSNETVCQLASKTFGRFNHPLALELLWHRLVEQPHPSSLTPALIQALAWSGHSEGVSYLLMLLSRVASQEAPALERPWPVPLAIELIQALSSLDDLGHFIAVQDAFIPLLDSTMAPFDTIQVKQSLIMAIAQLKQDSSIPDLIQMLKIDEDRFRLHVIAALKQLNRDLSYERLVEMSKDLTLNPELKSGIAIALKEW